jgi:hypothetical protein
VEGLVPVDEGREHAKLWGSEVVTQATALLRDGSLSGVPTVLHVLDSKRLGLRTSIADSTDAMMA